MNIKTIRLGTTKDVTVLSVIDLGDRQVVACLEDRCRGSSERKPYLLIEPPGTYDCRKGDLGTITFTERCPGDGIGSWRYTARQRQDGNRRRP